MDGANNEGKAVTPKEIALKVAWAKLDKPYLWGGDDPLAGFDCSGFVIECLKSAGVLPRAGDWTAEQLFSMFKANPLSKEPYAGCLVFWENPIAHVELCLDETFSIGASGGGSETKTEADAIKENAYVKIRPIRSRARIYGYVDPFL